MRHNLNLNWLRSFEAAARLLSFTAASREIGLTQSLDQHLAMLATWDRWFDLDQPFITIRLHLDTASLDQAPGTGKATKNLAAKWCGQAD